MLAHSRALAALLATSSAGLVMLAVILLATRLLTPSTQGLFFAFMSIGALVQLGDFGLSYAVMQKVSHLTQAPPDVLRGLETRIRHWSLIVAAVSTAVAGVLGYVSFSVWDATPELGDVNWRSAWGLGLAGLFAGQCASPVVWLMEGRGNVVAAWRLRMLQELAGGIACIAALICGWGLYALSLYWVGRSLISLPLLFRRSYSPALPNTPASREFRWREELWPFQWRIGLSSFSGFLIFRATTIVILSEQGPIVAGQYGLALAAMNMMLAVTTSWPNSQAARLGQVLAAGRAGNACGEARQTLIRSTLFAAASAVIVWVLFVVAARADLEISRRITDLSTLAVILATGVAHHAVACQAVLLRARVREPLLAISIIGGIANILGVFLASRFGTPLSIALAALTCALFGLGYCTKLFVAQCNGSTNVE
jgi:hypothetical protein